MLGLFLAGCLHRNKFRNNWIGHYFTIACHLVTPSQMMWKFSDQSKLEYYMMCLPKHKIIQPWKVYEKKNNDPTNYSTRSYATCSKSFGWSNQDTFNNLVDSGPGKGKPSPTYVSGIFHTSSWKKATRSSSLAGTFKQRRKICRKASERQSARKKTCIQPSTSAVETQGAHWYPGHPAILANSPGNFALNPGHQIVPLFPQKRPVQHHLGSSS